MRHILHCDLNAFYASVECLYHPELRHLPVAVGGDPEARHGIILTKNQLAKKYGVQTGETINEARRKCPGLVMVTADYPLYMRFSADFRDILSDYSDKVEPYGLDESWVDISAPDMTWIKAWKIANEIRERTKLELGITCSIGVGFTKPFAKLGSDMKKPDATTVITPGNYQNFVWPLPVSELLFVGPATTAKLIRMNIATIGGLAQAEPEWLMCKLGKNGLLLRAFANGDDLSPVQPCDVAIPIKSVGNSTTTPIDIETEEDAKCTYYILADSVAARLRENGFRSRCVSISVRTAGDLQWQQCQRTIAHPTALGRDIAQVAMALFRDRAYSKLFPMRSLGIHCSQLTPLHAPTQMDIFGEDERKMALERLEDTVRNLQDRNGPKSIGLGIMMSNSRLSGEEPREHLQPAMPYYNG